MSAFKVLLIVLLLCNTRLFAQPENEQMKFYVGVSYGTSYTLGDFEDSDRTNSSAGFADDGKKLDLYAGFPLNEKFTFIGLFRYQLFSTNIQGAIDDLNMTNPNVEFSGTSGDWKTYYLLGGVTYRINISKKMDFFPRIGLGPLLVTNPGINVMATNVGTTQNFSRSSETGLGVGYELGISLRNDFGKHFSLMPSFAFAGGITSISNVNTTNDSVAVVADYRPRIRSFNLGISVAYRFY